MTIAEVTHLLQVNGLQDMTTDSSAGGPSGQGAIRDSEPRWPVVTLVSCPQQTSGVVFVPKHPDEPATYSRANHRTRGDVASGLVASRGRASEPWGRAPGGSETPRPCGVHAVVRLPQSPLRRNGIPDVRPDRSVARIRPAVTRIGRCGVVDEPLWGRRSPYGCMDRRASHRCPATECPNRGF